MVDVQIKSNGIDPTGGSRVDRKPVVLIVDDHADTRSIIARVVRKRGFEVVMAEGLAAAVEVATERSIDVLISDIGLPDGSGHDVVGRLHEIQGRVPAIALSGYGMDTDVRDSLGAGFDVHLTKPVSLDRLMATVQRLVARRAE